MVMNLMPSASPKIENADHIAVSDFAREDQFLLEALQNFRSVQPAPGGSL